MSGDRPERTAYDRALAEPRFLRAVRDAYDGPADLLDALWWLDRPHEPGPSGAPAPAAEAAEARRALYRRSTAPAALDRYREAADREAATRAAVAAAIAAVDEERPRIRQRRLKDVPPVAPGEHARRTAPPGRWHDVFLRERGHPRVAPLVRLPRATVYAVETEPPSACLFLITDLCDFQCETASLEAFEREGLTLEVEGPLDRSIGLVRVQWFPTGEVRWETRAVERTPGPF